jgi:hypothetical protein
LKVFIGKLIPAGETYRKRHPELLSKVPKYLIEEKEMVEADQAVKEIQGEQTYALI